MIINVTNVHVKNDMIARVAHVSARLMRELRKYTAAMRARTRSIDRRAGPPPQLSELVQQRAASRNHEDHRPDHARHHDEEQGQAKQGRGARVQAHRQHRGHDGHAHRHRGHGEAADQHAGARVAKKLRHFANCLIGGRRVNHDLAHLAEKSWRHRSSCRHDRLHYSGLPHLQENPSEEIGQPHRTQRGCLI